MYLVAFVVWRWPPSNGLFISLVSHLSASGLGEQNMQGRMDIEGEFAVEKKTVEACVSTYIMTSSFQGFLDLP